VNSSGTLYGWGQSKGLYYSDANFDAEDLLGFELTGSVSRVNAFMQIDTNQWVSGSAYPEGRSFLLMKSDGTLWGLGDNSYGQLGVGNRIISEGARQVGSATWKQVSIGLYSAGGITTDDKLYTWGGNLYAQLGTGSLSDIVTTPVWIEQDSTWNSFSLGHNHALAVKSNGTLWTWGSASNGVMGLGVDDSFSVTPTQIGSDSDWSAVFASRYASFAIKTDGSLYGWGYNYYNQLGFGDADTIYNTPNLVDSGPWKLIISDTDHTYGLKTDSTLWGWGENDRKIIPDPNAVFSDEGDSGVYKNYSVVTGGDFVAEPFTSVRLLVDTGSCTTSSLSNSLLGSGSLTLDDTATGGNDDGSWQLSLPFNVVYCGISYSTIYVSTNSVIWFGSEYSDDYLSISEKDGYGYRIYYGQEGNTFRIRFEGDSRYQQDGGPKIWEVVFYQNTPNQIDIHVGENTSWKLTATNEPQLTPALVASGSWKSISTSQGSGQALYGVKSDGTLWMAGENSRGELGFGDNTEVQNWSNDRRITFVQLGSDTDWESVIGAKYTTWALKSS
jgi:alpha-tubulin suppressor-like RCC1 family protein